MDCGPEFEMVPWGDAAIQAKVTVVVEISVHATVAACGRKIPRAGYAAAQDDKTRGLG